jgi:hypothetical protein
MPARESRGVSPLAALAVVALFENREILEVALNAGHEILVSLPAHDPQLALAAGAGAADSTFDPQAGREPRPLGAHEDEEGANE